MKRPIIWVGLMAALMFSAADMALAQMESGRSIAEKWCANCHGLPSEPAAVATDGAPPFSYLAGLDADRMRGVLMAPHERMRGIDLTRRQIDSVIAYIVGLEAAKRER